MATSGKRKCFSIAEKYEILKELNGGAKRVFLHNKHGISYGTLSGFINNRPQIEAAVTSSTSLNSESSKQCRHPEIDAALLQWFRLLTTSSPEEIYTGPLLLQKAEEIGAKLTERGIEGYVDPPALGLDWIEWWKKRHGVVSRKVSGESHSADLEGAAAWLSTQLKVVRQEFKDEDIFNADETGLFWKMTPDRTLGFRGQQCKGGKRSKDSDGLGGSKR